MDRLSMFAMITMYHTRFRNPLGRQERFLKIIKNDATSVHGIPAVQNIFFLSKTSVYADQSRHLTTTNKLNLYDQITEEIFGCGEFWVSVGFWIGIIIQDLFFGLTSSAMLSAMLYLTKPCTLIYIPGVAVARGCSANTVIIHQLV